MTLGEYIGDGSGTTKLLLHLNGNSTDSSGNNNNGTDNAITYSQANGRFGQGAGFNGSTSYISIPGSSFNFAYNQNFSVSVWVKLGALNGELYIIEKWELAGGYPFVIRLDSTNHFKFLRYDGTNNPGCTSSDTYTTDVWYNIVGVKNGSTLTLYVNNSSVMTVTDTTTGDTTNGGGLYLGRRGTQPGSFYNGSIDELIIKAGAWTPQQVAKRYAASLGRYATL